MKIPNRYQIGLGFLFALYVAVVVGRWALKAADSGGYAFFSLATLQAIAPWIILLAVCLVIAGIRIRNEK